MTYMLRIQNQGTRYVKITGTGVEANVRPGDSAQLLFPDDDAVSVAQSDPPAPPPAPEPPAPPPAPEPPPAPPPAPVEPPAPAAPPA
jgi:hypothetical protein